MPSRTLSDEANVVNLCDEVLSTPALRQHTESLPVMESA
jgi:hypothetical protein